MKGTYFGVVFVTLLVFGYVKSQHSSELNLPHELPSSKFNEPKSNLLIDSYGLPAADSLNIFADTYGPPFETHASDAPIDTYGLPYNGKTVDFVQPTTVVKEIPVVQKVIEYVEVPKEVIKHVPVEVIKNVEVIRRVAVHVPIIKHVPVYVVQRIAVPVPVTRAKTVTITKDKQFRLAKSKVLRKSVRIQ